MNVLESMNYVTEMGERGRARGMENAFRRDSMAALEGDPDAFMRQAAIDPAQAVQVQQAGDVNARRIRGAAKYMQQALESQNPAQVQGAWNAVRPYLTKVTGKTAPEAWDDTFRPGMEQLLAQTAYLDQAGGGNNVQSRFVAEDGRVMMVMRDGSVVDSGQKADRQMWFRDHPGMAPELVGKSGQVIPVGQQAPQAAPMQQPQTQFTGADGVPVNIDPSLPPQVQAAIRANEGQWAQAPTGAQAAITGPQGQAAPSGDTPGAARPAMTPAQAAANQRAEEANRRAAEAAARAARGNPPAGYRWNADNTALEPIPGAPPPSSAQATEGERKSATLLRRLEGSLSQLESAVQADPTAAAPTITASVAGSLPFVGEAARNALNSSERQRVESAQLDILDAALTLGTGAAYTREQLEGYRRSFFPQLGDTEDNIRDKQARLQNVIEAARIAAGRAAPQGGESGAGGAPIPVRNAADYEAVPSGAQYMAPDGSIRRKR